MKKTDVNLRSLALSSLIAHNIPRRLKADELTEIPLSQSLPPLPPTTLDFFASRLQGTLTKRGQLVEVDPLKTSPPVPPAIDTWLQANEPDLIGLSHVSARHLYAVQGGSSSAGLLAVSGARLKGNRALALMKLPHEAGLSIESVKVDGKPTLSITVLDNLTLTENTRVFKAGLFWLEGATVIGLVSDDQTGEPTDIAGFFLSDFLGCRRRRQPKVLTKAFKLAVTEFISEAVEDEDDKLHYFNAFMVEMRSNAQRIDPMAFVSDHFADEHKAPLLARLRERGVPQAAFVKDLELLPKQGRQARLKTTGGLTISGDAEAIQRVQTREVDGEPVILIRDRLSTVR